MTSESTARSKVPLDGNTETASQKKVEANRRNAQLSTGPKTLEGKKTSSCNTAKHGLLAKDVVINTRGNKEDQAEFDTLLAQMRDAYSPVGIAEDLLVREIAIPYWRSARALRCERGYVTCAGAERKQSEISEMGISVLMLYSAADTYHSLLRKSGGIKLLLQKIEQARYEIGSSGRLSSELRQWLDPAKNWDRLSNASRKVVAADQDVTLVLRRSPSVPAKNSLERFAERSVRIITNALSNLKQFFVPCLRNTGNAAAMPYRTPLMLTSIIACQGGYRAELCDRGTGSPSNRPHVRVAGDAAKAKAAYQVCPKP